MTFVCKKMGVVRSILLLIILIFHILCVDAVLNENPIKKISGLDENEEKEALIVEKFRALLGLKSFHIKRPSNGDSQFLSPSPSPLPTIEPEAPSPSPSHFPLPHVYAHPFPPRHRSHRNPPTHKFHQHEDRGGRAKAILVGVLVSAGVASVICVIGLFWALTKFRNHTKKPRTTITLCSKNRGSGGGSCQNSSSQVGLNSTLDQHTRSLKQDSVTVNTNWNHRYHEKEVIISPEYYDNASSSSTKEILSDDKIITTECCSSDNESFHSLVDSHSSNVRLSNASDGNLSETLPHESPQLPLPKQNSVSNIELESSQSLQIPKPPPPPPPPPPLQMPLFSLHSLTSSSSSSSKSPPSSTFPNLSSPRDSESFSSLNQSIENEKNPSLPSVIPPPTCPPPPPPFRANNNNNVKTPPPPPSQLPQFTPRGKDGAPLPKLKPLHWDKVRAAPDRTMVWDKLRSSSFEFDEEMIESLFGYNLQHSMKNEETKSKSPSPSKHVLEPKRLQNITILSKALNVTAEQVCEALIQGRGLCLQQLEALVKMVPTKEEEDKLSSYKGDINEMGSAEKFVKAMLSVPFAFPRVDAMLYRETFEDEIVHLRNSFSMLEEACKELRSSRLFLKLLEAVLKTGNRMNVGTIRGGARAFKLDALLKLADVKGTDGKTTLLHFVVQEIIRSEGIRVSDSIMGKISQKSNNRTEEEKEDDYRRMGLELVSGLSTELYNVKKTATIDLDVLASSVSNLKEGVSKLRNLVHELHTDENSENFVDSMKVFLNYADRNLRNLQGDEDRVLARVKEITEYFHGDVSKEDANPLRIFVIVRDFMGMLDNVCKELRRSKLPRSPTPLAPFR